MKICLKCKVLKPDDRFSPHKRGSQGLSYACKPCRVEEQRQRRAAWSPAERHSKDLWKRYRLTLQQYEAMHVAQEGRCLICDKRSNRLEVDHDHTTGRVRGLLCGNCNKAIGLLGECTTNLDRAIDYLVRSQMCPERP